jgi:hypothetical protein
MKKGKLPGVKLVDLLTNEIGDKIKVNNFIVTPIKPQQGDLVRIKFSVSNVTKSKLKLVPWRIVNNKTILYSGYRFNLLPATSFDIVVTWEAVKGNHFFYVDIDPQNILDEPRAKQFDNFPQGVDVKVA